MLDMSWGEVMVIGAVALIVIGPKDLPKALRTVGQMTGKVRRMAAEFQTQFNEAMREAELDEVRKEIQGINQSVSAATSPGFNPIQTVRDELKGAVEGSSRPPGHDPLPGATVAAAAAEPHGGASPAVPVEGPSVALPSQAVVPIVDPAQATAIAAEEAAAANAGKHEPPGPDADKPHSSRA